MATSASLGGVETARELRRCFGTVDPVPEDFLREWAEMGSITDEDMAELLGCATSTAHALTTWADRLNLASPVGNSEWRLDPILSRILLPPAA